MLSPLLGNGMLVSGGAEWKWQRQTTAPVFRHGEVMRYMPAMNAAAEETIGRWRAASCRRQARDRHRHLRRQLWRHLRDHAGRQRRPRLRPRRARQGAPILAVRLRCARTSQRGSRIRSLEKQQAESQCAPPSSTWCGHAAPTRRSATSGCACCRPRPETGGPWRTRSRRRAVTCSSPVTTQRQRRSVDALSRRAPRRPGSGACSRRCAGGPRRPDRAEHIDELKVIAMGLKEAMRLYPPVPESPRVARDAIDLDGAKLARQPILSRFRHPSPPAPVGRSRSLRSQPLAPGCEANIRATSICRSAAVRGSARRLVRDGRGSRRAGDVRARARFAVPEASSRDPFRA